MVETKITTKGADHENRQRTRHCNGIAKTYSSDSHFFSSFRLNSHMRNVVGDDGDSGQVRTFGDVDQLFVHIQTDTSEQSILPSIGELDMAKHDPEDETKRQGDDDEVLE